MKRPNILDSFDNQAIDLLIIGAGPVGCTIAEHAVRELGWRCLIVEKRNHIAGNCYDYTHASGVQVHKYGPHYFRTDRPPLLEYLSKFTSWIPGRYIVRSQIRKNEEPYPFPINLTTLERFFKRSFTPASAKKFLDKVRVQIAHPKNSEEFVLSRVGRELYEAFYLGYTVKQWGKHPRELDPSVCGRIPLRFSRGDRYVDQKFQVMPALGYTQMFQRMISHPNIRILLNTSFEKIRAAVVPRRATVYTGPIDAYFKYRFGKLPWRSLAFKLQTFSQEFRQPCVQINYPNHYSYTRSVEIKHVTNQKHPKTVVSFEYPKSAGDPYYPILSAASRAQYERYRQASEHETQTKSVYFAGRLAQFCYINTDQALEIGIEMFNRIKREAASR